MGILKSKKAAHLIVMAGNRAGKDTGIIIPAASMTCCLMPYWGDAVLGHVRRSTGPASPAAHAAINRKKKD